MLRIIVVILEKSKYVKKYKPDLSRFLFIWAKIYFQVEGK